MVIQIQPMLRLNSVIPEGWQIDEQNSNTTNVKVKLDNRMGIRKKTRRFKYNQC